MARETKRAIWMAEVSTHIFQIALHVISSFSTWQSISGISNVSSVSPCLQIFSNVNVAAKTHRPRPEEEGDRSRDGAGTELRADSAKVLYSQRKSQYRSIPDTSDLEVMIRPIAMNAIARLPNDPYSMQQHVTRV